MKLSQSSVFVSSQQICYVCTNDKEMKNIVLGKNILNEVNRQTALYIDDALLKFENIQPSS